MEYLSVLISEFKFSEKNICCKSRRLEAETQDFTIKAIL